MKISVIALVLLLSACSEYKSLLEKNVWVFEPVNPQDAIIFNKEKVYMRTLIRSDADEESKPYQKYKLSFPKTDEEKIQGWEFTSLYKIKKHTLTQGVDSNAVNINLSFMKDTLISGNNFKRILRTYNQGFSDTLYSIKE